MCNAWNHPPSCTCGWGGDGHLGRGGGGWGARTSDPSSTLESFFTNFWSAKRLAQYDSYVNPNAKCPICGATVFFCQLSNGGRVYFDDLGPPWPKHPCTDNSYSFSNKRYNNVYPEAYFGERPATKDAPDWQRDGWDPVRVVDFAGYDIERKLSILKFERVENDDVIAVGIDDIFSFKVNLPIFIKEKDEVGQYEVSCLLDQEYAVGVDCKYYQGYSHVHKIEDFDLWMQAITNDADAKNRLALFILFNSNGISKEKVSLSDASIDWAAVEYWLELSRREGSRLGLVNLKKLREARKHKTGTVSVKDFLFE